MEGIIAPTSEIEPMRIIRLASNIQQVATTTCTTIYDVDGEKVELSMIVGGEPMLRLQGDYFYSERYPKVEAWSSDKYWDKEKGLWNFQDPNNIQGPTYDVLPEGKTTIEKFVAKYVPRRNLTKARYDALPTKNNLTSERVNGVPDDEGSSAVANLHIHPKGPDPVKIIWGRRDRWRNALITLFPEWWKRMYKLIGDAYSKFPQLEWADFTEEEYNTIVKMLHIYLDYYE